MHTFESVAQMGFYFHKTSRLKQVEVYLTTVIEISQSIGKDHVPGTNTYINIFLIMYVCMGTRTRFMGFSCILSSTNYVFSEIFRGVLPPDPPPIVISMCMCFCACLCECVRAHVCVSTQAYILACI